MADRSNANDNPPRRLTVDAPPPPIPKDMQGSENPIPLSPQWLLPKPVDSKLGILSGEPHSSPHHGYHPEAVSASGNVDSHDAVKRKDVFRPSLYDLDSGRRDRWHDEERETHSANRRDRWREGEKELGDARRIERWSDNSARHLGEGRRAPAERRTDSNNRDNTYDQRRESKWNTRWGPDDKESENRRDKWSDSSRVYEGSRDKGTSQLPVHGQDLTGQGKDTEGEHSRSWRSNSFLARGRGESNLPQTLTPSKQASPFGYGRGKGDNGASVFSAGRGRVDTILTIADHGSSRSYPLGFASERSDGTHSDQFTLKYSRMKLLDIYRMTDLKSHRISLEGFVDVPSLTISEPLEPLALSAPTSEELATLKGIDKGDIVSSGLPQVSKEGSTGKNSGDSGLSRQPRLGSREDTPCAFGDYRDETSDNIQGDHSSYVENSSCAKYSYPHGLDSKVASSHPCQENKLAAEGEMGAKEVSMPEKSSSHHTTPWRSQSVGERSHGSSVHWQDYSAEARSRTSDMGSMHLQKNLETEQRNSTADSSSYFRDKSQNNDLHSEQRNDFKIKRQSSEVMDLGREDAFFHGQEDPYSRDRPAGKLPPSLSPEDLSLYYKDPQGRIQGPFTGSDLIGWFEAGYFGIDLQVRLASAPVDAPFSLLGDVMPHLRAKARPPPGFGAAKQNDVAEVSNTGKFGSLGNAHSAVDEFEAIKNMQRNRHEVGTEAENRFIESLMSGNMNNSSSEHYSYAEGMKGYSGSSTRVENMRDMNYLLAQRISLERQRSLPTAGPYWSDKDVSSFGAKPDMVPEIPSPHAKFLPNVGDASGQIPQSPHHVDFLAMLQAAADKSSSSTLNSAPIWPNMTEVSSLNNLAHGGMDIMKDKVDMHHNQHMASQTGFGAQHQRLHPQAPPSLPHLLGQPIDLLSGVAPPEKLLAPEISQDPQLLSLLQQQYLISQIQLHSQSALPSHLSLLDKYLLLKQQQQQKQEQQQQHLLQQQQQQLLSQVLSASQLQLFGDPSSAHFKASAPAGNASVDRLGIHQIHETLLNNQQMPIVSSLDGHSSNVSNFNLHGPKDVSYTVNTGPSPPHLPHGMLDHSSQPAGWDTNLLHEVGSLPSSDPKSVCKVVDSSLSAETIDKNAEEVFAEQTNLLDKTSAVSHTKESMASVVAGAMNGGVVSKDAETSNIVSGLSEELNDVNISPENVPEKCHDDTPPVKDVKEGKKISEKKTRKKNSKSQLVLVSKHGKGSSKTMSNQQVKPDSETEGANIGGQTTGLHIESEQSLHMATTLETGIRNSVACAAEPSDSHRVDLSSSSEMTANEVGFEGKAEVEEVGMPSINLQTSSNRAWKPAPGLKPKSLLEIQQEEQRRLQAAPMVSETSAATMPSSSSRTPWAGVVANYEQQAGTDIVQNPNIVQGAVGNPLNSSVTSRIKKSQLHDLLAEEVLAKSKGDTDSPDEKGSSLPPFPQVGVQAEIQSVDDDFIEAKDTKKSRKKASKAAKAAGPKASPPVASAYLSTPLVSAEKSKSTRQTQQEKELLPVMPSGPSLGDFVLWKGDQTNSSPAPAWSTDSTKLQKPTSLRDILREQEKKGPSVQQQVQIPTPPKVQSNRGNLGSGSSWPIPGSSPSKVASPSQTKAASPGRTTSITSNESKAKTEDDLFWGPLDQSKQETRQSVFPSLANPSSLGGNGPSGKGVSGVSLTRQKPAGVGLPSSAADQSFSKGRRDAVSKHSEAKDFRDWCESELVKLTGTTDTSFLEFCLKQSTSEAELLLRENLGSLDHNHEFIDKFLNYKDFLAPDVVEMAFGAQNGRKMGGDPPANKDARAARDVDAEGGGKKKGKKGKKVSPAVLGFNVVSNRIMMGEIQTIED